LRASRRLVSLCPNGINAGAKGRQRGATQAMSPLEEFVMFSLLPLGISKRDLDIRIAEYLDHYIAQIALVRRIRSTRQYLIVNVKAAREGGP
jgi:hypothetical protein